MNKLCIIIIISILLPFCKSKDTSKNDGYYFRGDVIVEMDSSDMKMLPYCNIYLNEKFIKALLNSKGEEAFDEAIKITVTEPLIIGVFIGGGKRSSVDVPHDEILFSGQANQIEYFKPDFYFYSLYNYLNYLYFTDPGIPLLINEPQYFNRSLGFLFKEKWDTVYRKAEITKLNDSINYKGKYKSIWKIEGLKDIDNEQPEYNVRFIEMNFLREKINTPLYNINHSYFKQLLEYAIEDILGKTEYHYLDPDDYKHPEKYESKIPD